MAGFLFLCCVGLVDLSFISAQWLDVTGYPLQVQEGESTELECNLPAGDVFQDHYISWIKNNRILAVHEVKVDISSQSSLQYSPSTSNLMLHFLNVSDSGYYDCVVFSDDPRVVKASNRQLAKGTVRVNVSPKDYQYATAVQCSPENNTTKVTVRLGDTVTLVCDSFVSSQYLGTFVESLQWFDSFGFELTSSYLSEQPSNFYRSALTINAAEALKTTTFTCIANGDYRGYYDPYYGHASGHACYVTVNVKWPATIVEIRPRLLVNQPSDDAKFTCVAFEYLQDNILSLGVNYLSDIEWRTVPEIEPSRLRVNGKEALILDVSPLDNNTLISCAVSIDGRWYESNAMLYVNEQGLMSPVKDHCPSSATAWIVAFVMLFLISTVVIVVLVYYIWKHEKSETSNTVQGLPHTPAEDQPNYGDRPSPKYTGLGPKEYVDMGGNSRVNSGFAPSRPSNDTGDNENEEYVQSNETYYSSQISPDAIYVVPEAEQESEYVVPE